MKIGIFVITHKSNLSSSILDFSTQNFILSCNVLSSTRLYTLNICLSILWPIQNIRKIDWLYLFFINLSYNIYVPLFLLFRSYQNGCKITFNATGSYIKLIKKMLLVHIWSLGRDWWWNEDQQTYCRGISKRSFVAVCSSASMDKWLFQKYVDIIFLLLYPHSISHHVLDTMVAVPSIMSYLGELWYQSR